MLCLNNNISFYPAFGMSNAKKIQECSKDICGQILKTADNFAKENTPLNTLYRQTNPKFNSKATAQTIAKKAIFFPLEIARVQYQKAAYLKGEMDLATFSSKIQDSTKELIFRATQTQDKAKFQANYGAQIKSVIDLENLCKKISSNEITPDEFNSLFEEMCSNN